MSNEELNQVFAKNLNAFLQKNHMNQIELAKRIHAGAATVNDWVSGRSTPRTKMLARLVDVFECQMSDLISTDGPGYNNRSSVRVISDKELESELKAAFFGGYADDLSEEDKDALWRDAQDVFEIMIEKKRRENKKGNR